jgi:hypothetical protein
MIPRNFGIQNWCVLKIVKTWLKFLDWALTRFRGAYKIGSQKSNKPDIEVGGFLCLLI